MTVSVLGLGAMGSRLAARLLTAGHVVTVWNRSPGPTAALESRGAAVAVSLTDAARASDLVLSIVRDDDASRDVWEGGALDGLRAGTLVAEMSTLTPGRARLLADRVAERGGRFLDAPVVGSRPQAEAGALHVLAGGDAADVDAVRPVFSAFAGAVHPVGPHGAGMAMKLAVNAMLAVQAAALGELLAALAAEGIAPSDAATTLAMMPTSSPAASRLGAMMADGTTAPNFPIALVAKDAAYARQLSRAAGIPSHAVAGAARAFAEAEAAGLGALDLAAVARLYRDPASGGRSMGVNQPAMPR